MAHVEISALQKAEKDHLACTYACLLLADSKLDITAEKISQVLKSTGNGVAAYYPAMFARSFGAHDVLDLVANAGASCGGGGGAAPAQAASSAPAGGEAKKEKEPEPEEEEVDMDLGGMFGDEY